MVADDKDTIGGLIMKILTVNGVDVSQRVTQHFKLFLCEGAATIDLVFVGTESTLIEVTLFTHIATVTLQLRMLLFLKVFQESLSGILISFRLFELILTANLDHFFSTFTCDIRRFILR